MPHSSNILFVCLGNICRSPLAEALADRHIRAKGFSIGIDSAGISDFHKGEAPCPKIQALASRHGLCMEGLRSRPVVNADKTRFTHIIALDEPVHQELKRRGFKNSVKLGSFGYGGACIADPYYENDEAALEEIYRMVETCVDNLLKRLSN